MTALGREALDIYEALRAANPHLPPARKVIPGGFSVDFGSETTVPKVTVTCHMVIPPEWLPPATVRHSGLA